MDGGGWTPLAPSLQGLAGPGTPLCSLSLPPCLLARPVCPIRSSQVRQSPPPGDTPAPPTFRVLKEEPRSPSIKAHALTTASAPTLDGMRTQVSWLQASCSGHEALSPPSQVSWLPGA